MYIYICFFPLCIGGFYLSLFIEHHTKRVRVKNVFLILASLLFYGWTGLHNLMGLIVYILLVFVLGKWLQQIKFGLSKIYISICIVILSSILFYFKYFNFMNHAIDAVIGVNIINHHIYAMAGISFITFSAISYLIDVYRNDARAGNLWEVALYLTFFPKIISGPIVLWKDFSNSYLKPSYSLSNFIYGLNRIIIGLSKKVILADSFGATINNIEASSSIDCVTAWGCAFLYYLQIYYDFSGYSDIAIGLSKVFGFNVAENFNFPYRSLSITEFWRRWHISLGNWFKEYVYIPLGGNRKGKKRTLCNLFIVFFITGVWHGAGMGYLFWGVLHGVCVLGERCLKDTSFYNKIPSYIKWLAI